jgi:hypothetical protein
VALGLLRPIGLSGRSVHNSRERADSKVRCRKVPASDRTMVMIWNFLIPLFYLGRNKMKEYEDQIFDRLALELSNDEVRILRSQLNNISYIQRWQPGRLHAFFIRKQGSLTFPVSTDRTVLGTVYLSSVVGQSSVNVEIHLGLISYMTFSRKLSRDELKHLTIRSAKKGGDPSSVLTDIDVEEHGPEGRNNLSD